MMTLSTFFPPHRVVSIMMILLIIITLIQGVVFIQQMRHETPPLVETVVDVAEASRQLIASIPEWHLFGIAPVVPANLSQTSLQLDLNGVMTGDKKNAYAIIAERGKDQKLYRTGDTLPGGAVLYQIGPQGIVIQYNSELEQLPLVKPHSNNNN